MASQKRAAIYLRVSTSAQDTDNQLRDLQAVAAQREWSVVDIYRDHGISGAADRDKRPAFSRLTRDADRGRFDIVMAWSIDRVGRSLSHLVGFIDELKVQNVGLYLHQQQVDTSTAAGRAFLQMAGVFAEFERSIIVERVNAGLRRARAQGKQLGRPRVSYKIEAAIRQMRSSGAGKLKIARTLGCGVSTVTRVVAAP